MVRLKQKWKTATSQKPLFYLWLIPAWVLLGLSRLVILTTPFRSYSRRLGVIDGAVLRSPLATSKQEASASAIGTAIKVAANYAPWNANCFPRAITARIILGVHGIPYALFFGLRNKATETGAQELAAHAWVVSGPVYVTGGNGFVQYTPVGCFVSHDA
ncbi:lasso peptide biosynthesis B2 protein [Erythrobacter sp. F6033]|uniref:lasso peptide biosynthesis B2 protein n=1 Tax=Erythrobacter sp. F6033 TaxID=2926401 RepID=UPI001FF4CCEA|nr:lasso peptide biosynthesis B2 protein [Erythrobacter sp. F6033]MCK0127620.1 lasso peptide biosynthesis B2 protein [Erythrobacter sp. F6033]